MLVELSSKQCLTVSNKLLILGLFFHHITTIKQLNNCIVSSIDIDKITQQILLPAMHYSLDLTPPQAQFLQTLLPNRYSIQTLVQGTKRQRSAKKIDEDFTQSFAVPTKRTTKQPTNQSKASSRERKGLEEGEEAGLWRVLEQLKVSKCSWLFRLPVGPIGQCFPDYLEVVKEPMDLQTIETRLRKKGYLTAEEFHADMRKVISNSYLFHGKDESFLKITQDFQSLYNKCYRQASEVSAKKEGEGFPPQKKVRQSKQQKHPGNGTPKMSSKKYSLAKRLTAKQRQALFHRIYELPQKDIICLVDIVGGGGFEEWGELQVDLKDIDDQKFTKILKLIAQR